MLRDLLVHVTGDVAGEARLDYALAFARSFDARLTGIHVLAPLEVPPIVQPSRIAGVEAALADKAQRSAVAAKNLFERSIQIVEVETRWVAATGPMTAQVCKAARYADLVIVGQEDLEVAPERNPLSLADELVVKSGRPVVVVPDRVEPIGPRRILVAWDGSRQAVRAVHDALPLLRAAEASVVIVVESNHERLDPDVLKGDALIDHLVRHGVPTASVETLTMMGSDTRGILKRLEQDRFDLLVMGAFRRSPLIEGFLGGTTADVMRSGHTPVFMAH